MRHVLMTQTDDELLDDAQQISTAPALDRLHSREREREKERMSLLNSAQEVGLSAEVYRGRVPGSFSF